MRHVVLVNESFVQKNLGAGIRRTPTTIDMKDEIEPSEIVGVLSRIKTSRARCSGRTDGLLLIRNLVYPGMTLMLRTRGDAGAMGPAARNVIDSLDSQQPLAKSARWEDSLSTSVERGLDLAPRC